MPGAAGQEMTAARTVRRPRSFDQARDHVRTFCCIRAAWNRALAARRCGWHAGWRGRNDGTTAPRPADPAYIRPDPRYA